VLLPYDEPENPESEPQPAAPERAITTWAVVLIGATVVSALMLAARAESPPDVRGFFDIAIFAGVIGVASFAIVRLLFVYPFRLLDLMMIVIVLSLGMKGAIEAAHAWRYAQEQWLPKPSQRAHATQMYILYAESCMITGCVMLGGAVMGLRHCRLLAIDSQLKRNATILCAMVSLPALAALILIPIKLLNNLVTERNTSRESLTLICALLFSFVATLANAAMALKTIALTAENAGREGKWREK